MGVLIMPLMILGLFPIGVANDFCPTSVTLSNRIRYSWNTDFATDDTGITSNCGDVNGFKKGVWFTFNSEEFDQVSVTVCDSSDVWVHCIGLS